MKIDPRARHRMRKHAKLQRKAIERDRAFRAIDKDMQAHERQQEEKRPHA